MWRKYCNIINQFLRVRAKFFESRSIVWILKPDQTRYKQLCNRGL